MFSLVTRAGRRRSRQTLRSLAGAKGRPAAAHLSRRLARSVSSPSAGAACQSAQTQCRCGSVPAAVRAVPAQSCMAKMWRNGAPSAQSSDGWSAIALLSASIIASLSPPVGAFAWSNKLVSPTDVPVGRPGRPSNSPPFPSPPRRTTAATARRWRIDRHGRPWPQRPQCVPRRRASPPARRAAAAAVGAARGAQSRRTLSSAAAQRTARRTAHECLIRSYSRQHAAVPCGYSRSMLRWPATDRDPWHAAKDRSFR